MSSEKLYHHGIKGQRWGVRRFQNKDGSLTSEGEKRYLKGQEKANDKKDSKERARRAAKFSRDFAIDVMGKQVGASLFGCPVAKIPTKKMSAGQKAATLALDALFAVSLAKLGHTLYKSQYDPDTWVKWESPFGKVYNISDILKRRRSRVKPLALGSGNRVVKTIYD